MLKSVTSTITDLPDAVAALYKKAASGPQRGRYVLQVEAVDDFGLVDVEPMKAEEKRLAEALEKRLVTDEIERAVTAAGGNLGLLRPHLEARAKLDRATLSVAVIDDQKRPYYNNKGEPGTIADVVADLKTNSAFARAFDAAKVDNPQTLAPHKASPSLTEMCLKAKAERATTPQKVEVRTNPWRRETWNLTDQMRVTRADPTRAEQLRAEAER